MSSPVRFTSVSVLGVGAALMLAAPVMAQDTTPTPAPADRGEAPFDASMMGDTVFDGDWISVGIGVGYGPSYEGSDSYKASVLPLAQGSFAGVNFDPRPGGLALDFIPDATGQTGIDLGVAVRLRGNRTGRIGDAVVESLGELDRAVEVGPTAGVSFPGVLNPFDSVSVNVDARWDVAGAHDGLVIDPSITYFTPLSRAMIASFTLGATYGDDDYAEYYYSIDGAGSVASGLPQFAADGGFTNASATLLLGLDLDGDATNGGLAIVGIGGYSRLLGDAKDTPITSIRGSADQFLAAVGVGYTF